MKVEQATSKRTRKRNLFLFLLRVHVCVVSVH